jgi:hypothetical protein
VYLKLRSEKVLRGITTLFLRSRRQPSRAAREQKGYAQMEKRSTTQGSPSDCMGPAAGWEAL